MTLLSYTLAPILDWMYSTPNPQVETYFARPEPSEGSFTEVLKQNRSAIILHGGAPGGGDSYEQSRSRTIRDVVKIQRRLAQRRALEAVQHDGK